MIRSMGGRVHSLLTEAWHFVLLVAATGLAVSGIAALLDLAAGKRGGHEVVTVVIALVVVGLASVGIGVALDPMGFGAYAGGSRSPAVQAGIFNDERFGLPPRVKKEFRRDDVLYAGGVMLIGLAVLVGYACTWAGVPPTNPFG
jgi:hypothetical protein